MSSERRGLLFIVSAPSGTGKTTLVERLVPDVQGLRVSRSYTSRPPRIGEHEGVDYNFISRAAFEGMIADGGFLEWADVFGNLYGTGAAETVRALESGVDLVLVIDVQGARKVRATATGFEHVGIFVLPPSFDVLESRLRRRSADTEAAMLRRLEVARREVEAVHEYDYVVINDDMDEAVGRLRAIIAAERARLRVMRREADAIIRNFQQAVVRGRS